MLYVFLFFSILFKVTVYTFLYVTLDHKTLSNITFGNSRKYTVLQRITLETQEAS